MDTNFLRYNALDSACTFEIWNAIEADLKDDGFDIAYQNTINLLPVLIYMQTRGLRVDKEALAETQVEVQQAINRKQEELDTLCGFPLNVNSPKACKEYFYGILGCTPYKNKDGKDTTDDLALQRLARGTAKKPGLRQASLVQEIRRLQKLLSTYLNIEFDPDDRMRCSFNPRGTKFGRLSSSKTIHGTGMNMQNLPQAFKKFLVTDPGYTMVEVDKSQAEWVVVAYASGDANMLAAIEQGLDVHAYTASRMFNIPVSIIKYENSLIGHVKDATQIKLIRSADEVLTAYDQKDWPRTMSMRQAGKKSNHGLNYDEGARTFALVNEITESEANKIIDLYHQGYPGIRHWHSFIQTQLRKDRTLTNCFGRKIRFLDEWSQSLFKSAYSSIPQSTVVDSLNLGMVKMYEDTTLPIEILAQVHDSILFQLPTSIVESDQFKTILDTIDQYISPTMSYNGRDFKIKTDVKIGQNWGEHNAETNPTGMREYDWRG